MVAQFARKRVNIDKIINGHLLLPKTGYSTVSLLDGWSLGEGDSSVLPFSELPVSGLIISAIAFFDFNNSLSVMYLVS